jgi:GNAT superfamily N-acetyltransferase
MRNAVTVSDLCESDIPDALSISKKELGTDYQDEHDFSDCIGSKNEFCKIATVDGHVVGFSICKLFGPDRIDEVLKLPECPEYRMLHGMDCIGLFDSMSILDSQKGNGIGTMLGDACLDEMKRRNAKALCGMAWKQPDGTTNAKKLLERMGLHETISIPGYWNLMVDSPEGHHCPVCGAPCKCYAALYIRII